MHDAVASNAFMLVANLDDQSVGSDTDNRVRSRGGGRQLMAGFQSPVRVIFPHEDVLAGLVFDGRKARTLVVVRFVA